jgi:hypothetical protein
MVVNRLCNSTMLAEDMQGQLSEKWAHPGATIPSYHVCPTGFPLYAGQRFGCGTGDKYDARGWWGTGVNPGGPRIFLI